MHFVHQDDAPLLSLKRYGYLRAPPPTRWPSKPQTTPSLLLVLRILNEVQSMPTNDALLPPPPTLSRSQTSPAAPALSRQTSANGSRSLDGSTMKMRSLLRKTAEDTDFTYARPALLWNLRYAFAEAKFWPKNSSGTERKHELVTTLRYMKQPSHKVTQEYSACILLWSERNTTLFK